MIAARVVQLVLLLNHPSQMKSMYDINIYDMRFLVSTLGPN